MKKIYIIGSIAALALLLASMQQLQSHSYGAPSGYTNAPGDGNCTACHLGGPLNGTGLVYTLSVLKNGIAQTDYMADSSYDVKLTMTEQWAGRLGFAMKCVGGTLSPSTDGRTQNGGGYITHNTTGCAPQSLNPASSAWVMPWTAPPATIDTSRFYTSMLVADGSGSDGSDTCHIASLIIPRHIAISTGLATQKLEGANVRFIANHGLVATLATEMAGAKADLFDINGRLISSVNFTGKVLNIPTHGYVPGIYLVRLQAGNASQTTKVFVPNF